MKHIAAALVFFTRLPLWRLKMFNVPPPYFKEVINYWAVAGWLTGGVMAGVLWLSAQIFPIPVAVALAVCSRILLTGALHEDGFADFLDGFGGGIDKERILSIMKDSHIGTYGVIGLILYFLLLHQLLSYLPLTLAVIAIATGDPLAKFIGSFMTFFLPYARTADTNKNRLVYNRMSPIPLITSTFFGLLPLLLLPDIRWLGSILFPMGMFAFLVILMRKKIGGYTGDCCGAVFILSELSYIAAFSLLYHFWR